MTIKPISETEPFRESRCIVLLAADNNCLFALWNDDTPWTLDTLELEANPEWMALPCIPQP
jgi:hypothetical protein